MITTQDAEKTLRKHANPQRAAFLQRFFKSGPGEYGAGDKLLGISVPVTRSVAHQFRSLSVGDALKLLESEWHEVRLMALLILVSQYDYAAKTNNAKMRNAIYRGYLKRISKYVNNWDLVDFSAHYIVGRHLENAARSDIHRLSRSKNLWERRVAMISTYYFIKQNDFPDALRVAQTLLNDRHDLIHKAAGWMLREIGNRSFATEKKFLDRFARNMPRTMLRYAIEKFPQNTRKKYLAIKHQGIVK